MLRCQMSHVYTIIFFNISYIFARNIFKMQEKKKNIYTKTYF